MAGGVSGGISLHGGGACTVVGCVWQGGMHGGGVHGRGHAWQGVVHGQGVHGRGVCMAVGGTHPAGIHSCCCCGLGEHSLKGCVS